MGSTSESGHAVNLNNMKALISAVGGLGAAYDPSNELISKPNLEKSLVNSQNQYNSFMQVDSINKGLITARAASFDILETRVTQIMGEVRSSRMAQQNKDTAAGFADKIRGKRASAKLTDDEKKALEAKGKSSKQISASQQSFNNRISNFTKLVTFLETIKEYTPKNKVLTIAGLKEYINELSTANDKVINYTDTHKTALNKRDAVMYAEETGMTDLALTVKEFVKTLGGVKDPRYKNINAIKFKNLKGK